MVLFLLLFQVLSNSHDKHARTGTCRRKKDKECSVWWYDYYHCKMKNSIKEKYLPIGAQKHFNSQHNIEAFHSALPLCQLMPVLPIPHISLVSTQMFYFVSKAYSQGVLPLIKQTYEKYVTDRTQTSSCSLELVFSKQSILF